MPQTLKSQSITLHQPLQPMAADGESGRRGVAKQPVVTLTWSKNRNLVFEAIRDSNKKKKQIQGCFLQILSQKQVYVMLISSFTKQLACRN